VLDAGTVNRHGGGNVKRWTIIKAIMDSEPMRRPGVPATGLSGGCITGLNRMFDLWFITHS